MNSLLISYILTEDKQQIQILSFLYIIYCHRSQYKVDIIYAYHYVVHFRYDIHIRAQLKLMCTIRYTHISYVAINQTVHPLALGASFSSEMVCISYSLFHTLMHHRQLLSLLHGCNIPLFSCLMGNPNGWLAAPLLAPTKSTARHEKPHIFFHSIDWLFDIHMNVFIYSMASEMALSLPELYSFCTIAVRGYNLNIAAKTSSSGLQIHTCGKSPSTVIQMSCFFIECPPADVSSVTNCNSGRKLYRLDVMICDVSHYTGVDVLF